MARLLPFLLASLVLPACNTLGERASGGCPDGETCSSLAPNGLEFSGRQFADDDAWFGDPGVKTTAVGGTQSLQVYDHGTGAALTVPFAATIDDGGGLAVDATAGNTVAVAGVAEGWGRLTLRDSADALLDRVVLDTEPVDAVVVRSVSRGDALRSAPEPVAVWATAQDVELSVGLLAPDGFRVVDDGLQIVRTNGPARQTAWDAIVAATVDAGLSLEITAGSLPAPVAITVPAVTQLTGGTAELAAGTAEAQTDGLVCFHGDAGDAEVLAVPWTFAVDGPASIVDQDVFAPNCVYVALQAEGTVTVTGTAPGAVVTATLDVGPAPSKPGRRLATAGEPLPRTWGERAD